MKEIMKNGLSLFLKTLVILIMSFILTISINVLAIAGFTENIGYNAYVSDENGDKIAEYTHYSADGDDTELAEYEEKGYTVQKNSIRSELKGKGYVISQVVTQFLSLVILCVFVYNSLFVIGNKDFNAVKFKRQKSDILKGLKIGLVSVIPYFAVYLVCVVCAIGVKPDLPISLFNLCNFYIYQILVAIVNGSKYVGDLAVWQFILILLSLTVIPLISCGSYILGYKDVFWFDKFIFKKKK